MRAIGVEENNNDCKKEVLEKSKSSMVLVLITLRILNLSSIPLD